MNLEVASNVSSLMEIAASGDFKIDIHFLTYINNDDHGLWRHEKD